MLVGGLRQNKKARCSQGSFASAAATHLERLLAVELARAGTVGAYAVIVHRPPIRTDRRARPTLFRSSERIERLVASAQGCPTLG